LSFSIFESGMAVLRAIINVATEGGRLTAPPFPASYVLIDLGKLNAEVFCKNIILHNLLVGVFITVTVMDLDSAEQLLSVSKSLCMLRLGYLKK
jgi:hypothetical protein